jgi:sporulation protein YhbH
MALKIHQDHSRFRQIVRGKIKQNLKKYISKGEMIGKQGKDLISIPVPQIDLPHFKFDHRDTGGVGQGEGDVGQVLQPGNVQQPGQGHEAGSEGGDHSLEVDISFEELAQMLGEALELPNIEPKGKERIVSQHIKYTGVQRTGPESLRHFRRTFKQALRRQLIVGTYDPKHPVIVPTHDDRRYRSWKVKSEPETNAVIIYMMDVSGSMGDEQKEIVRIESFWIDTWLRHQYKGIETRYIIHDAMAKEVDRDTFFHTRESGGTMISSAYKLAAEMVEADYPASEYNIYPFHFSDGDNWSADDTRLCMDVLRTRLIPVSNVFCYGQVESPYGSGQFIKDLKESFGNEDAVITSEIPHKEAIYKSIKDFLGKGK